MQCWHRKIQAFPQLNEEFRNNKSEIHKWLKQFFIRLSTDEISDAFISKLSSNIRFLRNSKVAKAVFTRLCKRRNI